VKFAGEQQQQQQLSSKALAHNFYCKWDQVQIVVDFVFGSFLIFDYLQLHIVWSCCNFALGLSFPLLQRHWVLFLFQQVILLKCSGGGGGE
jgi:hypothetical protein